MGYEIVRFSFLLEIASLIDAKSVLFIRNDKAQSGIEDIFTEQGVGSEYRIALMIFQFLQNHPAFPGFCAAG